MSLLVSAGQAILSGIASIGSAIASTFGSVANDVTGGFSSVVNFFQQLPSDIADFFQSLAGAIVSFGHMFGGYIWNGLVAIANGIASVMAPVERGLETIGSAIMNALATLWNDLKSFASNIFNTVYSAISGVISFIQPVFNDVKNVMVGAYNFLSIVVSDIYAMFTTIANFFLDMPTFFQNIASFLNSLFTDPGNQPNLLTMIPNIIASEVSRITRAFPAVVGYNTYMKLLPEMVSGISNFPVFGRGFKGIIGKALLLLGSPFLTALISMMTETLIQSFFSPTQTTQVIPRPSQPQIQTPQNLPSTQLPQRSTGTSSVSDLPQLQLPSLTAEQIELQLERPNTTGVFVQDVIGMGTSGGGSAKLVSGYVNFQNALQEFQDVFEIVPNFFMKLIESVQFEFSQDMTVDVTLTILENIYQAQQTIEIVPSVTTVAITLPPGIKLCNPNDVPPPSEDIYVSSSNINMNTTLPIRESLCIPPFDLLADGIQQLFAIISKISQNIADNIIIVGQILSEIQSPNFLSDNISVQVQFTGMPPPSETYTYYVPVDVPFTYTIQQVGSTTYSGTLSYTVSGS